MHGFVRDINRVNLGKKQNKNYGHGSALGLAFVRINPIPPTGLINDQQKI